MNIIEICISRKYLGKQDGYCTQYICFNASNIIDHIFILLFQEYAKNICVLVVKIIDDHGNILAKYPGHIQFYVHSMMTDIRVLCHIIILLIILQISIMRILCVNSNSQLHMRYDSFHTNPHFNYIGIMIWLDGRKGILPHISYILSSYYTVTCYLYSNYIYMWKKKDGFFSYQYKKHRNKLLFL